MSSSNGSGVRSNRPSWQPSSDRLAFDRLPSHGPGEFNRSAAPGAWRENLRREEQDAVTEILRPKLIELGYD